MNLVIKFLNKQAFQPGLAGVLINPFYFIRRGLYVHIRRNSPHLSGNLIDFGCGRKPYRNLFKVTTYTGVDIEVSGHSHENSQVDVFYDGKKLPFNDGHFDSMFTTEVFEHIFNLEEIMKELHRVLKKGGKGLITVPFAWPEHEVPYDFGRYTSFGMKSLLERTGFTVISMEKNGNYVESLVQLFNMYVYSLFSGTNKYWNTLGTILFISPFALLGSIFAFLLPRRNILYHNLVILVEKT